MRSNGRWILAAVLAGVLGLASGCDTGSFLTGFSSGFALGLGAGGLFGNTTTTCYRNGQPIDCSLVPDSAGAQ